MANFDWSEKIPKEYSTLSTGVLYKSIRNRNLSVYANDEDRKRYERGTEARLSCV